MKSTSILKFTGILCLIFFASSFIYSPTKTIDLQTAIQSKQVTADISSNGKYRGRSVQLSLNNTSDQSIEIKIPAGTIYMPSDDGEQTLVQLEDEMIALAPGKSNQLLVPAFCTEASDRCPKRDGKFTIGKTKNAKLKKMISYLKGKKIDKSTYQDAVWAITDNESISNIDAADPATTAFRKHVAALTGQKDTWYTSPQEHQVDQRGNINSETVTIKGELKFNSDGKSAVHQELCDHTGKVLYKSNASTPRKSDNVTMRFSVRVKGWEKGDYIVKVVQGTKELKQFPFKV